MVIDFVRSVGKADKKHFDVDTVKQYLSDALPHIERLAPLLQLTDVTHLGQASLAARWALGRHVKSQGHLIKRSAIYGVSPTMRMIVGAVLRAAGRENVRVTASREDAE